ncbi:amidohydrolase [Bacillus sp. LL01]|nr:amidohydrolase [Bacillus sp. LL01]
MILGNGEVIEGATLLVHLGSIVDVGMNIDLPSDTEIMNVEGTYITPGLIDVHTHIGVFEEGIGPAGHDFNETSQAATPHVRAIDGINPFDRGFEDARAAGVTTVQIMKKRDLGMEQLSKVIKGEIPLCIHAHRSDDIVTILRLLKEFEVEATIEHCTEGHLIAEYLSKHSVRVSVGPTMTSRTKVELNDKGWHTLLELEKHDVPFAITTDHPVVTIDHLITSAQTSVKNGLSEQTAFKAITLRAAEHIGIAEQVGSLEQGKDADFVIWSHHPFNVQANVMQTFINGKTVYGD